MSSRVYDKGYMNITTILHIQRFMFSWLWHTCSAKHATICSFLSRNHQQWKIHITCFTG